ncbi:Uncharacterised protein [Klebsiella pneumoniae]|nr:Uncharacterised protein [Klebsiella pneumoniae]
MVRHSSVLFIALLAFSSANGQGKDWYQDIGSTCSGYTPLNDGLQTFFAKSLPLKSLDVAHGFAVLLTATQVDEIKSKSPYLYENISIDSGKAKVLKDLFKSASEEKVPVFFKAGVNIFSGLLIPNVFVGVSSGLLFDYAYDKLDSFPVKMGDISILVADGGLLKKNLYYSTNSTGDYLISEVSYTVTLGNEFRGVVLFACALPISYQVTEFETEGPFNNKKLRPVGGGVWQRWDIEDAKYDQSKLRYTYQDKDNYYFEEDEIEYGSVVGVTLHKVSLKGGPWQRKKSDSSGFVTTYAKVKAK